MNACSIGLYALLAALLSSPAAGEAPSDAKQDTGAAARARVLAEMRKRAEKTKVFTLSGNQQERAQLVGEPLVRYSDQPRVMADATMWAFGKPGRPQAMLKVEAYRRDDGTLVWLYSLGSLADSLITVQWGDGHRWKSKQPGLKWQPLSPAPPAEETPVSRLRQMKDFGRRFTVRSHDPAHGKEELRLLPQPIHRYADPKAGIVDAAIFGFASFGTNPNALVLIELHKDATGSAWRFAPARATDAGLEVCLDGQQVWAAPVSVVGPVELDTWLYFWEAAGGPGD